MTLAEKIIALRTQHHLSQGDLAEKIGVSRQSVSKWETGASTPDLDKLILMSELFSITLDELVKGEGASIDSSNITETTANAPSSTSAPKIGIRQIFGFILFGGSILLGLLNLADTSLVIIAFCLALCSLPVIFAKKYAALKIGWTVWVVFAGFILLFAPYSFHLLFLGPLYQSDLRAAWLLNISWLLLVSLIIFSIRALRKHLKK